MELSWPMRLRIVAVAAVGVILIGFFAWPIVKPPEILTPVSLLSANMHFASAASLIALAFLAGFITYFLSWPYGRQIAILAAPAGLATFSLRTASMAALLQQNPTVAQRLRLFSTIRWEPIFWLAIVAAGFTSVLAVDKILTMIKQNEPQQKTNTKTNINLESIIKAIIALFASTLIAYFSIRIFAQDVKIGSVVAQPAVGQIAFAVAVSFALAGFVVKKFLDVSYIWPIASTAFVTFFAFSIYTKQNLLQQLSERFPPVFFPHSVLSILPVQMVAFGTLGSIAGFWLGVKYNYWRKQQSK
ncbi:MAG: hypothetical protein ACYS0I_08180 [Planctomycetota bacterium]